MPDEVIKKIEEMGRNDKMSEDLSFQNRDMTNMDNDDFTEEFPFNEIDDEAQPVADSIPAIDEGVNIATNEPTTINDTTDHAPEPPENGEDDENQTETETPNNNEPGVGPETDPGVGNETDSGVGTEPTQNIKEEPNDNDPGHDNEYQLPGDDEKEHSDNDGKNTDESNAKSNDDDENSDDIDRDDDTDIDDDDDDSDFDPNSMTPAEQRVYRRSPINTRSKGKHDDLLIHYAMTQISMKKGLKLYGEKAKTSVANELKQLHTMESFEPVDKRQLTDEDRDKAMRMLMFLKNKKSGELKGCGVVDGRKKRGTITKEEAASPTPATESVLMTSIIDAHERRDVATCDIQGEFLHAKMDDYVIMLLEGTLAELMERVAPQIYSKYVTVGKNGKKMLYVRLRKAVYGCLKSALLFYKSLAKNLTKLGFKINFYDPCVANKMVKNRQMTIVWHVDDLKISHHDPKEVSKTIKKLEQIYGKMKVTRGDKHDYLGMKLDFSSPGVVRIDMRDYTRETIEMFPETISRTVTSPAVGHLFEVNPSAKKLTEDKKQIFHTIVARSLFASKRGRPDTLPTVGFLCTRVREPDEDDWKKLARLMCWLKQTKDEVLTLGAKNMQVVKWWVDGSYAVHRDCKSQTGGTMSLGRGSMWNTSQKQKINTKSSTKTELVAADDCMAQIIWKKHFLEEQGYNTDHRLQQDNTSSIKLEINGRASSGKRTRHMDVRYFFIKDRVDSGELKIEYCPTTSMVGDFFTKPLQGKMFRKFYDAVMGNDTKLFNENPDEAETKTENENPVDPRSVLNDITNENTGEPISEPEIEDKGRAGKQTDKRTWDLKHGENLAVDRNIQEKNKRVTFCDQVKTKYV